MQILTLEPYQVQRYICEQSKKFQTLEPHAMPWCIYMGFTFMIEKDIYKLQLSTTTGMHSSNSNNYSPSSLQDKILLQLMYDLGFRDQESWLRHSCWRPTKSHDICGYIDIYDGKVSRVKLECVTKMHAQLHNDDIYLMHIFRGLPISAFLCRISVDQNLPASWGRTIGDESGILLNGNLHIYRINIRVFREESIYARYLSAGFRNIYLMHELQIWTTQQVTI